jgi:small nuclear ribonucleoprotein
MAVKPLNMLNKSMNNRVIVELRGTREYRGILDGYDPHMNLVLKKAEELLGGEKVQDHESVIVRGDNVIYISP